MKKEELLIKIANVGYNIAYGAQLNYFSYHTLKKYPIFTAITSLIVSLLALIYPDVGENWVKAGATIVLILSIVSLFVEKAKSEVYLTTAKANTLQRNRLSTLYSEAKGLSFHSDRLKQIEEEVIAIEKEYSEGAQALQLPLAHCYAHYKFFTSNYSWMDEQLQFKFWKNMVPPLVKVVLFILLAIFIIGIALTPLAYFICTRCSEGMH